MKIGVIADSHDRMDYLNECVNILKERDIETIFHLGDFVSPFTIPLLDFRNVFAVFGNNDGDRLQLSAKADDLGFRIHPGPRETEVGGRRIVFMHEPYGLESFRKSDNYDLILFAHTHEFKVRENPLTVNPGELCGWLSGKGSFVIIDLKKMSVEQINL